MESTTSTEYVLSDFNANMIFHDSSKLEKESHHLIPCQRSGESILDIEQVKIDPTCVLLPKPALSALLNRLDEVVAINDSQEVEYSEFVEFDWLVSHLTALRQNQSLECFQGTRILTPASNFVRRLIRYGNVGEYCSVIAAIYIERLNAAGHPALLSSTTLQRLLLVAIMTAAKFFDDFSKCNRWWWDWLLKVNF